MEAAVLFEMPEPLNNAELCVSATISSAYFASALVATLTKIIELFILIKFHVSQSSKAIPAAETNH
ncbi:hypothetical protein D3C73_1001240 [compost metagenome]